ncbi:hypothetical protein Bca4012_072261 [Brassica carinata]|uniref:Uncharacterized protein n=1 Tax=Brassica carinata TaxID=52824 RepID=A0A8X7U8D4_BRACI|nr:hypothetical protein Bca52824_064660 [Brassica carinata]
MVFGCTKKDLVGGASIVMFAVCSHIKSEEVVYLLALSGCGVASEAREEPIHSPIAYFLWIWRGSTSTVIYCNHAGLVFSLSGFSFSL